MNLNQIEQTVQNLLWESENAPTADLGTRCDSLESAVQQLMNQVLLQAQPSQQTVERLIAIGEILSNIRQMVPAELPYQMPDFPIQEEDEVDSGITVELIRETFYSAIPQALDSIKGMDLITKDDIEMFDEFVIDGLPGLALYTAVEISQGFNGICLVRGKVVDTNTCPPEFKQLFPILLQIKEGVKKFTDKKYNRHAEENIRIIKTKCIDNPKIALESHSPDLAEIMKLVALIKTVAMKVTQRETFRQNAKTAFEVYSAFADQ